MQQEAQESNGRKRIGKRVPHQRQEEQKGSYEILFLGMGLHSGPKSTRIMYQFMCLYSRVVFTCIHIKGGGTNVLLFFLDVKAVRIQKYFKEYTITHYSIQTTLQI